MSLRFRNGTQTDVPDFARIVAHSFPTVGATTTEWENLIVDSPQGGLETLWIAEEEGRIVGGCRLLTFRQWIGGRSIRIMGLSSVAVSPTDRRRGLAGLLTVSALRESRRKGDLATALYPFRDSFYRKLGYGMAGEVQQFILPPAALPDHPGRARVKVVVPADERSSLASVYDRWAPTQTGQFQRSERAWERIWEGQGAVRHGAIHYDENGDPTGYAVFRYLPDLIDGKRTLEVEEIVWLDRPARLGLYGWLGSLSDQWGAILYRAHPEEAFPEHLADLRTNSIEAVPRWRHWFPGSVTMLGPMFRLVDVERAWRERTLRPGAPIRVALEVHDDQLPENGGRWLLRMADGRVEISTDNTHDADLTLNCGIEALSRIYIGAITSSSAVGAGIATTDRPEHLAHLDSLLVLPKPWTLDRF